MNLKAPFVSVEDRQTKRRNHKKKLIRRASSKDWPFLFATTREEERDLPWRVKHRGIKIGGGEDKNVVLTRE